MKSLIVLLTLCFSINVFAGYIKTKNFTCDELQSEISETGTLYIIYGLLGVSRGPVYSENKIQSDRPCFHDEVPIKFIAKTSDTKRCHIGYRCVRDDSMD